MEYTNLDEYDLSYELQYVQLMVNILNPYIKFKKVEQKMEIYLKKDRSLHTINKKQFIYFIQFDLPRIICMRSKPLYEEKIEEKRKHKAFINYTVGNNVKELRSLSKEEIFKKNQYYKEKYDHDPDVRSDYDKKLSELSYKIDILDRINTLNQTYHSSIQDILHFLDLVENYYL
jgi:hypothetical protein